MRTSDFDFISPFNLLAKFPEQERDESKLMIIHRKNKKIEHKLFKDLHEYFEEGDTLILNNTKVFPQDYLETKKKQKRK